MWLNWYWNKQLLCLTGFTVIIIIHNTTGMTLCRTLIQVHRLYCAEGKKDLSEYWKCHGSDRDLFWITVCLILLDSDSLAPDWETIWDFWIVKLDRLVICYDIYTSTNFLCLSVVDFKKAVCRIAQCDAEDVDDHECWNGRDLEQNNHDVISRHYDSIFSESWEIPRQLLGW